MSDDPNARLERLLAVTTADNDQDYEHGKEFFRNATKPQLMEVFEAIVKLCDSDSPVLQIVGWLAQLQFAEVVVSVSDGRNPG